MQTQTNALTHAADQQGVIRSASGGFAGVEFTPMGSTQKVTLTLAQVGKFIGGRTRSGKMASQEDQVTFLMLCLARRLNPWVGDALLVGYDSQDGPSFSLITTHQALQKRAELNSHYEGIEGGIVVQRGTDKPERRVGAIVYEGETLIGGWARCHRRDRKFPAEAVIMLSAFDQGRSRWKKDPAGMICKCAKSAAYRESFPNETGGLYTDEEIELSESPVTIDAPVLAPELKALPEHYRDRIEAAPVTPGTDLATQAPPKPDTLDPSKATSPAKPKNPLREPVEEPEPPKKPDFPTEETEEEYQSRLKRQAERRQAAEAAEQPEPTPAPPQASGAEILDEPDEDLEAYRASRLADILKSLKRCRTANGVNDKRKAAFGELAPDGAAVLFGEGEMSKIMAAAVARTEELAEAKAETSEEEPPADDGEKVPF